MASAGIPKNAEASVPNTMLTPQQKRDKMHEITQAALAQLPPLSDDLEEYVIYIPVQDGWHSRTKIVRPKAHVDAKRPLIVHFYGGGMLVGEPETLLNVAREFAETFGAVVALPSYRLVPDVRWPVQYKDSWDVLVWLSRHAEVELRAKLDAGFIVGGISAGGSLAAVCGGLAMFPDLKEAKEVSKLAKPLTGQFLCCPSLLVEETVPAEYRSLFTSREENKDVAGFNAAGLKFVLDGLQCTDYSSPWYSPIAAFLSQEPVSKTPVYLEYCGLDPFRDDATIYGKILEARGVQVKMQLFAEDVHTSWTVLGQPSKASNPTIQEAQMAGMKWLLSLS
jgi:acetyl esterase/lipase